MLGIPVIGDLRWHYHVVERLSRCRNAVKHTTKALDGTFSSHVEQVFQLFRSRAISGMLVCHYLQLLGASRLQPQNPRVGGHGRCGCGVPGLFSFGWGRLACRDMAYGCFSAT